MSRDWSSVTSLSNNVLPNSFGSGWSYVLFTVFLKNGPEGMGLKVQNIEERVVIKGFADLYYTLNNIAKEVSNEEAEVPKTTSSARGGRGGVRTRSNRSTQILRQITAAGEGPVSSSSAAAAAAAAAVVSTTARKNMIMTNDVVVAVNGVDAIDASFEKVVAAMKWRSGKSGQFSRDIELDNVRMPIAMEVIEDVCCLCLARPVRNENVVYKVEPLKDWGIREKKTEGRKIKKQQQQQRDAARAAAVPECLLGTSISSSAFVPSSGSAYATISAAAMKKRRRAERAIDETVIVITPKIGAARAHNTSQLTVNRSVGFDQHSVIDVAADQMKVEKSRANELRGGEKVKVTGLPRNFARENSDDDEQVYDTEKKEGYLDDNDEDLCEGSDGAVDDDEPINFPGKNYPDTASSIHSIVTSTSTRSVYGASNSSNSGSSVPVISKFPVPNVTLLPTGSNASSSYIPSGIGITPQALLAPSSSLPSSFGGGGSSTGGGARRFKPQAASRGVAGGGNVANTVGITTEHTL